MAKVKKSDPSLGKKKRGGQLIKKDTPAKNSDFGRIYTEEPNGKVNMSKIERAKKGYRGKILAIGAVLLVFLGAVALAGFYFFNRGQTTNSEALTITVNALDEIASGDNINFEISYLNEDKVALDNVELSVIYPDGFSFGEASPAPGNSGQSVWDLGNIAPGAGGKVSLTGYLIGNIGDTKTFMIAGDYTPGNFTSTFQTKAAHSVEITSSILELATQIPSRTVAGQKIEFKYKLVNNSENDLLKIRIDFDFPAGFSLISTDPLFVTGNNRLELDRLDAKNSQEITIIGSLAGEAGDTKEVKVVYGLVQEGGLFRNQGELSSLIYLVKPELNLQLEVNKNIQGAVVNMKDPLQFKVKYKNASEVLIENLELAAHFEGDVDILDFSTLQDEHQATYNEEENDISWTVASVPEFASIKPDDQGEFSFSINTKESFSPQSEDDKHLALKVKVVTRAMTINELGGSFEKNSESNQVEIKVNSKVKLDAQGWYYSSDLEEVGTGPLPPQVGETTSYRITWDITSLYNDLEEVEVSAKLPENVFYTGRAYTQDSGDIKFDSDSRLVTWKIHRVPANTGYLFAAYQAYFEVSITPQAKDSGKRMILLEKSNLIGRDKHTQEKVKSENGQVTTNLKNDNQAKDKGIVVPAENTNNNSNFNINFNCPECGNI